MALTAQLRLDSDDSPDDSPDPAVMYCHNMPGRAGIRDLPVQQPLPAAETLSLGSGVAGGSLPTSRPQPLVWLW